MEASKNLPNVASHLPFHNLQLLKPDHPRLRLTSIPVTSFDRQTAYLALGLYKLLDEVHGLGLSASQAGVPLRLIVVKKNVLPNDVLVLANPVIVKTAGEQSSREGCFSVPKDIWFKPIKRALRVVVEYQTLAGEHKRVKAHGLGAAVLQHQIDLLSGKLMTDYLPAADEPTAEAPLKEAV